MSTIHPKLKKFFTQKLEYDLKKTDIITFKNEFWILDIDLKEWFLYLDSQGSVWYNQFFFQTYKNLFSLENSQLSNFIKEWIELRLGFRVTNVARKQSTLTYLIDGMLINENNQWTLNNRFGFSYNIVKRYVGLRKNSKYVLLEDFIIS